MPAVMKTKKKAKSKTIDNNPLQLYEFHGFLRSTTKGNQHIGACPFCDHDDHFYINKDTGQFDCKSCLIKGNGYVFLREIYESCLKSTKIKHWKLIAKERQDIPWQAYRDEGIAYDNLQKVFLFPVLNDKGSITNLYKWSGQRGSNLYSTPTCNLNLIGTHAIESSGPIYLTEGHWDYVALKWLLNKEHDGPTTVLAVPGAGNFREERDVKLLVNRDVNVTFDNDDAGRAGQDRTVEILHRYPLSSLKCLQWPESFKDGYDVEDLIAEELEFPKKALTKLDKFLQSVNQLTEEEENIEPIESWKVVVKEYKKHMHLSKELEDMLALLFAVTFSIRIEAMVPLWMFFVGSPGSGKSLLLQSLGNTRRTHFESSLGPKTLVSGQKGPFDPSLLPHLIGRTLIIKDWTTMLSKPAQEQEEVFGVLRDVFDGRHERTFGNGMVRVYPDPDSTHKTCHFSIASAVTHAIYKHDRADYGERWLRFELTSSSIQDQVRRALRNSKERLYPEFKLRPIANAFLAREVSEDNMPRIPLKMENRLVGLGTIISFIRSKVERHQGRLVYRPALEAPTRIAVCLQRLCEMLAFVYNKPVVDDDCYRLVKKVALDTCCGWHRDAFLTLMKNPRDLGMQEITDLGRFDNKTQTFRSLNDLKNLGAVTCRQMNNIERRRTGHMGKGNIPLVWRLSPEAKKAISQAKLT